MRSSSPSYLYNFPVTDRLNNPFGALAGMRGVPAPEPAAEAEPAGAPAEAARVARAVVRMERAGRGGKVVTAIDHLGLPAAELGTWLKALKAALGCGGVVEGERVLLQGDHRSRVADWLRARGVRKVTIG